MKDFHQLEIGNLLNQISTSILHTRGLNTQLLKYGFFGLVVLITFITLVILRKAYLFKKSLSEDSVLLELTPPSFTEKESYTTEQLFALIHSLTNQRSLKSMLLGNRIRLSLEIVSTRNQGIRYLIRTTPKEIGSLRKGLLSYMPQMRIEIVEEYLPENIENSLYKVSEYGLSKHFAYPLKKQTELSKHDPIAYITGMMTKLHSDELISLQIVLSSKKVRETKKISKFILNNGNTLRYLKSMKIFRILTKAPDRNYTSQSFSEQDMVKAISYKINQPLFETTIRLLLVSKEYNTLSEKSQGLSSSFATYSTHGYQTIVRKRHLNIPVIRKYLLSSFKKRIPSFANKSLLSVSEISDIYHFPYTGMTKTEDLVKLHSSELPAPLSLKNTKSLDVNFGINNYGGTSTQIGLTQEDREKHMYVIGATGSGKSTMILSMAKQDIENGRGLAVIDPHGDLAETLLSCIPENRKNDLIYINPDDLQYPIGINLLELTPGLDEDDVLREKEFITESVISLFRKVFSDTNGGHAHRIEYILRNSIQTALTLEDPTLFTIYDLLNNPPFQRKVTAKLKDENLKNFWLYEYGKAGDYQKVKMISPVAARIGRFLFSPSAKRILEQKKSTINFDRILDEKKILICNFAKGKLGEDTSEVMGIMIVAKIQLAALKRARVLESERKPFYFYVDEFQNYASPSFIQMLSEARKYKVYLIMAEQSTSQQRDRNLVNVILANVGAVVSFRSANPEDEKIMLPQFAPYVEKGEIGNLPRYHFYMKMSAVNPEEPFSGETVLPKIEKNAEKVKELIEISRKNNATVYDKNVAAKIIASPKAKPKKDKRIYPDTKPINGFFGTKIGIRS